MDVSRHSKNQTTLPPQARYITSHDAMGKSIFDSTVPEQAAFEAFSSDMDYFLAYMTTKAPEDLTSNQDLRRYRTQLEGSHPPITIPGGLILRVCNFAPGSVTAMHRTISIDFGIVVAGEVELVLDSGETRLLKVGDITVQRATNHCWRVPSKTEWARMVYVLQETNPLEINGLALSVDHGGIDLGPASIRYNYLLHSRKLGSVIDGEDPGLASENQGELFTFRAIYSGRDHGINDELPSNKL